MSDVSVTFGAKDQGLNAAFKNVAEQSKGLGDVFKKMLVPLAAIGGAFLAARKVAQDFQKAIDMGGRLRELSLQTDESAGNLMILQRAFQNAGAGADAVGPVLARMNRFMAEGNAGGKEQAETMRRLGISFDDMAGKTPTEQLQVLAKAVQGIDDPAERANVAMRIFGRSGAELIPVLRAMDSELENARNQLGSAPGVADKAAKMFNELGNNLKAVREKSTEFAFGLLSQLLPNLVSITGQLATIDAAGIGAKFSEYAKRAIEWGNAVFGVGKALTQIKLGFDAIVAGDIGGGLKLIWLTMRDTALNAVNEIAAAGFAAIQSANAAIKEIFNSEGATMRLIKSLFTMVGAFMQEKLYSALSDFMQAIGRIGIAEQFKIEAETAKRAFDMTLFGLGAQIELVGDQAADIAKNVPAEFKKNYETNIKNPLIDMRDKVRETRDAAAEMEKNLLAAGKAAQGISDALPSFDGDRPSPNVPSAADIAENIARANMLAAARQRGSGGGGGGGGTTPAPRSLSARERALMAPHEKRASEMESQGAFKSADAARKRGEDAVRREREREARRDIQEERGMGDGRTLRSTEDIAKHGLDITERMDRDKVEAEMDKIEKEIKERAGQGDGTQDVPGGGRGKDEPTESPLEKLVGEIKTLVAKIEPRLPTAALFTT